MHHDSEKSQVIHSSVTVLGLCMGGDIQNTDLQRDSDEVEGFSKHGYP